MEIKEGMIVEWKNEKLKVFRMFYLSNYIILLNEKRQQIEITKDRFKEYIEIGIIKVLK